MNMVGALAIAAWLWGWGYWSHDLAGAEWIAIPFWPILWPLGHLLYWWRFGPKAQPRHVYIDTRWWQRGDRERRPENWMSGQ